MEIKEPVAIFTAEGFKMLIDALQGKKVDISAFTGERIGDPIEVDEKEIDNFIAEYHQFNAGEADESRQRANRTPEKDYKTIFDILITANEPLRMPEIKKQLAVHGIIRDPKSYTSLLNSAMKRFPIKKYDYGLYGVKPEYMQDNNTDGGSENE